MSRISIFGIGYVGAVTAACLARDGHNVVAVDINPDKVATLQSGQSPIVEPGLAELVEGAVKSGRLSATTSSVDAILQSDLSYVCVGTPAHDNGSLDISFVVRVADQIGNALGRHDKFHSVVMRSTMLPGTMERSIIPTMEKSSGKRAGDGFGVAYYPEFLREGSAIADYDNPGAIVFGANDDKKTLTLLIDIHKEFDAVPHVMSVRSAEAVKYANNAWHAAKISFANEIGLICKALGVDSHQVMKTLISDTRLNISPAYLTPGFAFGGSCLPKDLNALRYAGKLVDVDTPLLDGVLEANENQIRSAYRLITAAGKRKIGLVGLSFKPDTDDLRYSPLVEIAERLIGRGYQLSIYDPNIRLSRLTGVNRQFLEKHLPHIAELLCENFVELTSRSDVLVIGNRGEFTKHISFPGQVESKTIVDLVRITPEVVTNKNYYGLCW